MPRLAKLDLANVDIDELKLAILCVLDAHHCGPEFRKQMHGQFGAYLDQAGGAKQVLALALTALRSRPR
jgi:hypothetical protein